MSLTLHYHPLASFCWKPLIALYEADLPFEPVEVDLSDPAQRARLARLWPPAKFPVLEDHARNQVVPESTIVIEHLAQHYASARSLIPIDPDRAREARLWDRFFERLGLSRACEGGLRSRACCARPSRTYTTSPKSPVPLGSELLIAPRREVASLYRSRRLCATVGPCRSPPPYVRPHGWLARCSPARAATASRLELLSEAT